MDLSKKDMLFGAVIVVILGLLTLFMRHKQGVSASTGNEGDLIGGGYKTAQTVYVPTTSYDLHYDTNNGTIIHNGGTTTYTPTATGGMVSTPTQEGTAPQTSTTSNQTTNIPTTAPSVLPIRESQPAPAPRGTNTAPTFTAPSQANALAQLHALQTTIDRESSQMGANHFYHSYDKNILHAQKIELAREAGLSVDANGYVYDATGHRMNLGGTH